MHSLYYGGGYGTFGPSLFWGSFGGLLGIIIGILLLVSIVLKGYSLWYAAKRDQKWWFVILLIVNTIGILEIIYLLAVAKVWGKKGIQASPTTDIKQ
jgi:hypothetical protein